ncbi:MAG: calcium/sodium antiporter [Ectothiorhodospiraceae bacterium]|nr:calcium/sodium antiporter [Chromatiales bacterium]MCP5157582.1 calcium/sodium antiporter [Ectothiorhodospiraceae bacterium]
MLIAALAVVVGLAMLVWGADRFVAGASATARTLGVSPLVIGLTVVGIGTSAPEILVSAVAAWQGNPGVAHGNAIGSNIANIGLVLGACALVGPVDVRSGTLRREFPLLFGVMALTWMLIDDRTLSRADGALLCGGFALLLVLMVGIALRARRTDPLRTEFEVEMPAEMSIPVAFGWLLVGLALLLVGSRGVVWGAVVIAQSLGVSDLVIGLTVVAIGTSLPELATSVASVLKREHDIAVGNVIGSNMFNLLPVLGIAGLVHPGTLDPSVTGRDFPVMVVLTVALFMMAFSRRGPNRIERWEGAALLLAFAGYQGLLYFTAGAAT